MTNALSTALSLPLHSMQRENGCIKVCRSYSEMMCFSCSAGSDACTKKTPFLLCNRVFLVSTIRFSFFASSRIAIPLFEYAASMPQVRSSLHNLPSIPLQMNFFAIAQGNFIKTLKSSKSLFGLFSREQMLTSNIFIALIIRSTESAFAFLFRSGSRVVLIAMFNFL